MIRLFCIYAAFLVTTASLVHADQPNDPNITSIEANASIGDGKKGRVYRKHEFSVPNRPIQEIRMTLQRVKGGDDTYVNLRFKDQETLDNGKRVTVLGGKSLTTGVWNLNGAIPNGRTLVLNAYNGEVRVGTISVVHPGARTHSSVPPLQQPQTLGNAFGSSGSVSGNAADEAFCREQRLRRPRIRISSMRASGGLFSGKYRVEGVITGQCVEEAGYYERGRLEDEFKIPLSARADRYEFKTKVRSGRNGEIRVLLSDGSEDVIEVDDELKRQNIR